jgi:large subunit ribosomal protein L25
MSTITLNVDKRTETGKGPARRLRMQGKSPAIFYGKDSEPVALTLTTHDFVKALEHSTANPIFQLQVRDGENVFEKIAMLKERQIRPIDGKLVHADFLEVSMDRPIELVVPLEFVGKPAGVEKGGSFHILAREMKISCRPDNIPDVIKVDVSGLEAGHALHVGETELPQGVTALQDPGIPLASVIAEKKSEEEGGASEG